MNIKFQIFKKNIFFFAFIFFSFHIKNTYQSEGEIQENLTKQAEIAERPEETTQEIAEVKEKEIENFPEEKVEGKAAEVEISSSFLSLEPDNEETIKNITAQLKTETEKMRKAINLFKNIKEEESKIIEELNSLIQNEETQKEQIKEKVTSLTTTITKEGKSALQTLTDFETILTEDDKKLEEKINQFVQKEQEIHEKLKDMIDKFEQKEKAPGEELECMINQLQGILTANQKACRELDPKEEEKDALKTVRAALESYKEENNNTRDAISTLIKSDNEKIKNLITETRKKQDDERTVMLSELIKKTVQDGIQSEFSKNRKCIETLQHHITDLESFKLKFDKEKDKFEKIEENIEDIEKFLEEKKEFFKEIKNDFEESRKIKPNENQSMSEKKKIPQEKEEKEEKEEEKKIEEFLEEKEKFFKDIKIDLFLQEEKDNIQPKDKKEFIELEKLIKEENLIKEDELKLKKIEILKRKKNTLQLYLLKAKLILPYKIEFFSSEKEKEITGLNNNFDNAMRDFCTNENDNVIIKCHQLSINQTQEIIQNFKTEWVKMKEKKNIINDHKDLLQKKETVNNELQNKIKKLENKIESETSKNKILSDFYKLRSNTYSPEEIYIAFNTPKNIAHEQNINNKKQQTHTLSVIVVHNENNDQIIDKKELLELKKKDFITDCTKINTLITKIKLDENDKELKKIKYICENIKQNYTVLNELCNLLKDKINSYIKQKQIKNVLTKLHKVESEIAQNDGEIQKLEDQITNLVEMINSTYSNALIESFDESNFDESNFDESDKFKNTIRNLKKMVTSQNIGTAKYTGLIAIPTAFIHSLFFFAIKNFNWQEISQLKYQNLPTEILSFLHNNIKVLFEAFKTKDKFFTFIYTSTFLTLFSLVCHRRHTQNNKDKSPVILYKTQQQNKMKAINEENQTYKCVIFKNNDNDDIKIENAEKLLNSLNFITQCDIFSLVKENNKLFSKLFKRIAGSDAISDIASLPDKLQHPSLRPFIYPVLSLSGNDLKKLQKINAANNELNKTQISKK